MRLGRRGFTLTEVLVATATFAIVAMTFAYSLDLARRSLKDASGSLEIAAAQSEIANNLAESYSLGAGYMNDATALAANRLDPDNPAPQTVILLDASSGLVPAYTTHTGTVDDAPATARIANDYVLTSIVVQKKSGVPGAGDVGKQVEIKHAATGVPYLRRSIYADLILTFAKPTPGQPAGEAVQVIRTIPTTIILERPKAGGNWLAAKTASSEGVAFNVGWRDQSADCTPQITGGDGQRVDCPQGMFIATQRVVYEEEIGTQPCNCGKGCNTCPYTRREAYAVIRCCRIRQ